MQDISIHDQWHTYPLTEELRIQMITNPQFLDVYPVGPNQEITQEISDWDQNSSKIPAVIIKFIHISCCRGTAAVVFLTTSLLLKGGGVLIR